MCFLKFFSVTPLPQKNSFVTLIPEKKNRYGPGWNEVICSVESTLAVAVITCLMQGRHCGNPQGNKETDKALLWGVGHRSLVLR